MTSMDRHGKRWLHLLLLNFLLIAALPQPAMADLKQGIDAYEQADYATAFAQLKPAAELGVVEAQYRLALLYLHGNGVEKNALTARLWLDRAVRQGDATAKSDLEALDASIKDFLQRSGMPALTGGDGSSTETAIAFVGVKSEAAGVDAEHAVTSAFFPGWQWRSQALVQGPGNRPFDLITMEKGGESRKLYFDITDWFGEMGN